MSAAPAGPPVHRPRFLITIDTEGDNLWSRPKTLTTRNAGFLQRFQALAESSGLKPTYLTTYEMAKSAVFREFGHDIVRREAGEIGMHLHAWNTPPLVPLTRNDDAFQPYLVEYPQSVMQRKVALLTGLLEDTFGEKMVSHRAGRWSLNEAYARLLVSNGYGVDCSVTPFVSWRHTRGNPAGSGGSDYTRFPDGAYFLDLDDIGRPGDSPLLEVPVTIVPAPNDSVSWMRRRVERVSLARRGLNRLFPPVHWLRPNGRNFHGLLDIVRGAVVGGRAYVEFMLHSSELMPGGSPRFPGAKDVENLYGDLAALFGEAGRTCVGATLREFQREVVWGAEQVRAAQPAAT